MHCAVGCFYIIVRHPDNLTQHCRADTQIIYFPI